MYADRNVAVRVKEDSATWRAWLITWAVCMVLRVGAVAGLGLVASYTFFSEGLRNAYWYPGYEALAETIWTLAAGIVPIYVALHLALHSLIGPLVFSIALRLNLGRTAAWLAALGVAVMPYYVSMAARQPQAGSLIVVFAATFLAFLEWKRRGFRLLPGLAFDCRGGRLGRGGGYFDRAFPPGTDAPRLIGVGYAFQVIQRVPSHSRDRYVDAIVTEQGLRWCDPASSTEALESE